MKFLKFLFAAKSKRDSKPQSFAQKRAQSRRQSLEKAQAYRKKLIKQEYISSEPLKSVFKRKGRVTDIRIRKLKDSK